MNESFWPVSKINNIITYRYRHHKITLTCTAPDTWEAEYVQLFGPGEITAYTYCFASVEQALAEIKKDILRNENQI